MQLNDKFQLGSSAFHVTLRLLAAWARQSRPRSFAARGALFMERVVSWTIVLEGADEFGSAHRSELMIDKDMEGLSGWPDRILGRGWQGHPGSSPTGGPSVGNARPTF